MPFIKGESGNKIGRPKRTDKQKREKEQFQSLMEQNTVSALKVIIEVMETGPIRDRLTAAKYIIDKAYGANAVFLESDSIEPISIKIIHTQDNNNEWEDEEEWI